MRIALCDDNNKDSAELKKILISNARILEKQIEVFQSCAELINKFQENEGYDIVFLDIDMPEMNGIELGLKIKTISSSTYIVFVTNYPQYAINAFDCAAFHYLLKPLELQKVNTVLDSLLNFYQKKNAVYSFKTKSGYVSVPIAELYFVECFKKHLIFHMKGKVTETPGKLSDAYAFLISHGFCQVHQGFIVNMNKISSLDKFNVYLDNDEIVPISQRKRSEVLSRYAEFLGENL